MKKILLVDDHADIRRLIRITLGKNFDILEAEDGAGALEIVRQQRPDLVVLDIMMPGNLDGLQVLEAIRAEPQLAETRVIIVSARGQTRDYDEGMQRGATAYFVKPFSPLQLANAIKEALATTHSDNETS
jgi:CheY-like chemotaxis protein